MIVFESSQTNHPGDTLIQAREEIEVRWRRMMFYLSRDDLGSDDRLALECMDLVLKDIFRGLQFSWEKLISKGEGKIPQPLSPSLYIEDANLTAHKNTSTSSRTRSTRIRRTNRVPRNSGRTPHFG